MAVPPRFPYTQSQINKCGKRLKHEYLDEAACSHEEYVHATNVLNKFREAHSYPMLKVRYGLRSFVQTEKAHETISQRLKRRPRIVEKLARLPTMQLANLEDIGGVRAVFEDRLEMERVKDRLLRKWSNEIKRPRDYVEEPRDTGYRGIHVVVLRQGCAIEVQLRTRGQQQWADAVEDADSRHRLDLKDGKGPEIMLRFFRIAGELIYRKEYGILPTEQLLKEFSQARKEVIRANYYSR